MTVAVGVDGCKAGWFYFRRDRDAITHGVAPSVEALIETLPPRVRVCIDIPIGLPDRGPAGRDCDRLARQLLGRGRAASVFPAPYRPVLAAGSYDEAKALSFSVSGKKISRQTYAILSKIREVDEFLAAFPQMRGLVREAHPELCFWGLNQRQAMAHNKKTDAGFEERLRVLEAILPNARALVSGAMADYRRKDVACDDIVDALVCMVAASTSDDALQMVPAEPPRDATGLPMEIVYTEDPNELAL